MSKKKFQIDQSFQFGLLTLKCIENSDKKKSNPCRNCYFDNLPCENMTDVTGECEPTKREDGKSAIFVEEN